MSAIPPELELLAAERVRVDMLDRHDAFRLQTGRILGEMTARGVLRSGMTGQRIRDAVKAEVEIRAMLAWQTLVRILSGEPLPSDDALAEAAKRFVATVIDGDCGDLRAELERAQGLGGGKADDFTPLVDRALRKVNSEIEISLRKTARSAEPAATTVNIYQPYGIVQTGAGSTATFTANVTENKQVLLQALDSVDGAIARAPELDEALRVEAAELVTEAKMEVERAIPNQLRLRSMLGGLATTIQTVGSASAAYQALKGAAALLNVHLP
jgi:hypothetical protein